MSKSNGWLEELILAEGLGSMRSPNMLTLELKCLRNNASRRGGAAA